MYLYCLLYDFHCFLRKEYAKRSLLSLLCILSFTSFPALLIQLNTADKGIVRSPLREGNHDLSAAIGSCSEALLDSRFIAAGGIDIKTTQNRRTIDRHIEFALPRRLPGQ